MSPRAQPIQESGQLLGHAIRCPACEAEDTGSLHVFYVKMNNGAPGQLRDRWAHPVPGGLHPRPEGADHRPTTVR